MNDLTTSLIFLSISSVILPPLMAFNSSDCSEVRCSRKATSHETMSSTGTLSKRPLTPAYSWT